MTVQQMTKQIVGSIGLNYIFSGWSGANVRLDNERFPIVIDILPVSGEISMKAGQHKDAPNCLLFFCDKTELDFDAEVNQVIIERMKVKAMQFIDACNDSGLLEPIEENIPYQVLYDRFDVNVTGISIALKLKEAKGVCSSMLPDKLIQISNG